MKRRDEMRADGSGFPLKEMAEEVAAQTGTMTTEEAEELIEALGRKQNRDGRLHLTECRQLWTVAHRHMLASRLLRGAMRGQYSVAHKGDEWIFYDQLDEEVGRIRYAFEDDLPEAQEES
jgi:hypothetical protein